MTDTVPNYRWSPSEFVRAWEAGAFDHRVELVNGEVWPVVIGEWHGKCTARLIRALPIDGGELTTQTLPSGDSFPDPDLWVQRVDSRPIRVVGRRVPVWSPEDVLLVVEISDETMVADLTTKAALYGSAGFPHYWVVTREALFAHSEPTSMGYRQRTEYRPGDQLRMPYGDAVVDIGGLLLD